MFYYNALLFPQATLDYDDCAEVMRRWGEHLSGTQISQQVSYAEDAAAYFYIASPMLVHMLKRLLLQAFHDCHVSG